MRIFGFGFHERELRPASEDLAREWLPYAETSVEAFGADRCMFESNFPVDKTAYGYAIMWNAFKRLTSRTSEHEKAALLHETAIRVYGSSSLMWTAPEAASALAPTTQQKLDTLSSASLEVKAPGKRADHRKFKDEHDRAQWTGAEQMTDVMLTRMRI